MSYVNDAIEAATIVREPSRMFGRTTPTPQEVSATRRLVLRFLENIPDDMTAMEIRQEIEGGETEGTANE